MVPSEKAAQIGEGGAEDIRSDSPDSVPDAEAVSAEAASVSPISYGVTPNSYGVEPRTSLFGSAVQLATEPMVPPRPVLPDGNTILFGFPSASETGSGLQEHVAGNLPAPSANDAAAAEAPTAPSPPRAGCRCCCHCFDARAPRQ